MELTHGELFGQVVSPHLPMLKREAWMLARCNDTADELVQQTLVSALRTFKPSEHYDKPDGWLFVILRSRWLDHIKIRDRRERRLRTFSSVAPAVLLSIASEPSEIEEHFSDEMQAAFYTLPQKQRDAILLTLIHNFSDEEVAVLYNVSRYTVQDWSKRGRRKMLKNKRLGEYAKASGLTIGEHLPFAIRRTPRRKAA
jgi:RNA polymerase sigma-70 factor (ECF subfamily)